ncbi:hypothetical protein G6F57_012165 [Rhizopus arrhizus]|nr:hypothetical protein G6F57_012165 [Rhizopus arrhizus]
MATDLHAQVSASLMRPEQRSLRPMQWPAPPKLVALYFGADWCAPCHAFVPTLRSVRDALREAGADTEVVYAHAGAAGLGWAGTAEPGADRCRWQGAGQWLARPALRRAAAGVEAMDEAGVRAATGALPA